MINSACADTLDNGPTKFESTNCHTFPNHIWKCDPIENLLSKKIDFPLNLELRNDKFFLSMDQSINVVGHSSLQSTRQFDKWVMNATDNHHKIVFGSIYDNNHVDVLLDEVVETTNNNANNYSQMLCSRFRCVIS